MSAERERVLSDDALDRLAREFFAEVRAQRPRKELRNPDGDAAGDIGINILDCLLDTGSGDDAGDGSGD